ncbi:MAG: hypothetical protein DRO73_10765 [Candidatus Thorarchaeota archaeon]|nr:MAG: hypothetical protein DRO73_10765 [Candidatus Thorarchaeota archaeon]
MLVTRQSPIIGYDRAAQVAESTLTSGRTIRETIQEMGIQIPNIDELLDPYRMAFPESNQSSHRRNDEDTGENQAGNQGCDRTEA